MKTKRVIDAGELLRALADDGPPYTAVEVGALLRMSRAKVYELARTGHISRLRPPGSSKVLFSRESVRAYLAACQATA